MTLNYAGPAPETSACYPPLPLAAVELEVARNCAHMDFKDRSTSHFCVYLNLNRREPPQTCPAHCQGQAPLGNNVNVSSFSGHCLPLGQAIPPRRHQIVLCFRRENGLWQGRIQRNCHLGRYIKSCACHSVGRSLMEFKMSRLPTPSPGPKNTSLARLRAGFEMTVNSSPIIAPSQQE